ncbi:hypothetical protein C461_13711 [Halorubrum aidingense JCM 13560]|uniref:DUF7467 domain-containing protein n=1 Tax=Halorubrum aidingense JCM 13560 TaxID=1230454 RepID=M0P6R5_9EURY|nr:SipW-dependent-type signal peptide-containing protein [Halorubrum aidingense]EMA65761.1 hypothetical protein C461_13711 [Halorubrum aidingense JCM 13560]
MTFDGSGSRRASGVSRRRLLAGLGGVGAVGMASGAGTFAYLSDRETFASNEIGTGTLELLLDGDPVEGPITIGVADIDRGASGHETLELGVRTNAARVWLATDCPRPDDHLAEALEVRLSFAGEPVSGGWRSFGDMRRELVDGVRLDDGCLDPDAPADLVLHWRLPADADGSLAGASTSFGFRLYAEQCRHVDEADAGGSNPFAGIAPCDEPDEPPECAACEDGDRFARLTFAYLGPNDAHIVASTQGSGTDGGVAFEGSVSSGGTFTADGAAVGGDGELGTNLYLDDGNGNSNGGGNGNGNGNGNGRPAGVKVHTSCSEDLVVGQEFGSDGAGGALYRLTGGEIAGKGPICGDSAPDDSAEDL